MRNGTKRGVTKRCDRTTTVLALSALFLFGVGIYAPAEDADGHTTTVRLVAESGFLDVVDHRISYADEDTPFRYHEDGGQDVLFPFARVSAEVRIRDRHTAIFLYQPLELRTSAKMPREFTIDGEDFRGSELELLYSFPFYRVSYLNDFVQRSRFSLGAGASLQIRNATIEFAADGERAGEGPTGFYRSADVGPVPLLKVRMRYDLGHGFWLGAEADGIYAPVSYINGSDNETVGALLDASVRVGYTIDDRVEVFLNARYLGGGASNTDDDNYTVNWINLTTVSLGAALTL